MQSSNEPAQRDLVIQHLEAIPSLAGRGHVNKSQQDPCDNLEHEHCKRGASENVEPARCLARHWMFRHFGYRRAELQALIEPRADLLYQAHVFVPLIWIRADGPGVGNSPALITRFPPSILYWCSNKPRSGGPDARDPS